MSIFKMNRIGIIMEPETGNQDEVEGVLNPAAISGPDGELYIISEAGCIEEKYISQPERLASCTTYPARE